MKATLVSRTDDRATVRLTPSWLGRLFGAGEFLVELRWRETGTSSGDWVVVGSNRTLYNHPDRELLRQALERVPVAELPLAVARST